MSNTNQSKIVIFTRWVLRYRISILLLTMLITLGAAYGGKFLGFDNDYRKFFGKHNPQLKAFEKLQNVFSKNDNILIAIEPENGTVFDPEVLALIAKYTDIFWLSPYVTRVDSLTNYQHTFAEDDDLMVQDLIPDPTATTPQQLQNAKAIATTEPLLVHRIISPSGDITAINVTVTLPDENPDAALEVAAHAKTLVEQMKQDYPNARYFTTGTTSLSNAFAQASMRDLSTLIPLMYVIIFVIMIVLLRSLSATFISSIIIIFSTLTAMGIFGWLGLKITGPSSSAPTIILTLGVADSVHILLTILQLIRKGLPKHDAIVEAMRINFKPVFLTSLTTVIGFLSLNFSDTPPIRDLGNITAIGVTAAYLFSIFTIPALAAILPIKTKQEKNKTSQADIMLRVANFTIAYKNPLLIGMSFIILALGIMISKIELNDEFIKYFDTSIPFRVDSEYVANHLTGLYQIDFAIDSKVPDTVSDPEFLTIVEEFSNWLRQQPHVIHVSTITDIMKRLNRVLHQDNTAWYKIPEDKNLAAQYLLLYEMSLPYGLDLNNQINIDKSSTRVSVTLDNIKTSEIRELADASENWLKTRSKGALVTEGTSPAVMFSHISERNINSMIKGTSIALLLITICLILALKSLRYGLISIIPNMVPVVMAFGVWGLCVGQVGFSIAIMASVTIGIIVDDTVHFLTKYVRARREENLSPEDAIRYAFSTVGIALLTTSIILILGFGVLILSPFLVNNSLGTLSVITIFFALIADFFLLPALLLQLDKKN